MDILDGKTFAAMAENGFKDLKEHYLEINELNVFPVPDGDTGTNMTATLKGGVESMKKADFSSLGDVATKLANGMLLSARGNSGVILSQFFAGIGDGLKGYDTATLEVFAKALERGTETAYKAVVNPVEGTILTVAREGTSYVRKHLSEINDFETLFEMALKRMGKALKDTPNLLKVLKEAGVIDSGGAGLLRVIEGMGKFILGEEVAETLQFDGPSSVTADLSAFNVDSVLEYGYCTEFILQLQNVKNGPKEFSLPKFIDFLHTIGDSIVAVQNDTIVKVHVHTLTPSKAIEEAQKYGEFLTFKMENMSLQHNEVMMKELEEENKKERAKVAMVAVAPSPEIAELFRSMGVSQIVSGGQSMNPSAEDFLSAFKAANAETIIVFPNNGNVILTAKQAGDLFEDSEVIVISSKSVIQAYSALPMVDFESFSIQQNIDIINESIENVVSGEVSIAVRDSVNNGIEVKKGNAIGILSGQVVSAKEGLIDCLMETISKVEDIDDRSVITLFYGEDAKEEDKEKARQSIDKAYPMMEIEEVEGNQKVYPFIIAVE